MDWTQLAEKNDLRTFSYLLTNFYATNQICVIIKFGNSNAETVRNFVLSRLRLWIEHNLHKKCTCVAFLLIDELLRTTSDRCSRYIWQLQ